VTSVPHVGEAGCTFGLAEGSMNERIAFDEDQIRKRGPVGGEGVSQRRNVEGRRGKEENWAPRDSAQKSKGGDARSTEIPKGKRVGPLTFSGLKNSRHKRPWEKARPE